MSTTNPRLGHAALAAILHDMNRYLPPDTIDRPGYKHCRTTYGLMNTTYQRSETSDDPEKEYKKLRALERDLRRRLNLLDVSKGVPEKMVQSMDEFRGAVEHALGCGGTFICFEIKIWILVVSLSWACLSTDIAQ
jgi:hypothetical protein